MKNNERRDICAICGGKCCKNVPGIAYPQDFGFDQMASEKIYERLVQLFSSMCWQIDCWERYKYGKGYYIRPTTLKGRGELFHAAWCNEGCVFLQTDGCSLMFDNRPYECKELVPRESQCLRTESKGKHPRHIAADKWLRYEYLIVKAADFAWGEYFMKEGGPPITNEEMWEDINGVSVYSI
jgi:hypothetical protein